jgi:hypothetical protein
MKQYASRKYKVFNCWGKENNEEKQYVPCDDRIRPHASCQQFSRIRVSTEQSAKLSSPDLAHTLLGRPNSILNRTGADRTQQDPVFLWNGEIGRAHFHVYPLLFSESIVLQRSFRHIPTLEGGGAFGTIVG